MSALNIVRITCDVVTTCKSRSFFGTGGGWGVNTRCGVGAAKEENSEERKPEALWLDGTAEDLEVVREVETACEDFAVNEAYTQRITSAWMRSAITPPLENKRGQSSKHPQVVLTPSTRMVPCGLAVFSPVGIVVGVGTPGSFTSRASRLPSTNTLTSRRCVTNVIEDARKRTKSNAIGIGAGSRRGISKVVHALVGSSGEGGRWPRRA